VVIGKSRAALIISNPRRMVLADQADHRQPRQEAMLARKRPKKARNLLPTPACVYCGRPATTRDHVPPKAIFVELHLSDLVTVPACEDCNNRASQSDEGFRNIMGMRASEKSPNSLALWQKTFRSLRRRRHELQALWESLQEVPIFTESGLYLGAATEGAFDQKLTTEPSSALLGASTSTISGNRFLSIARSRRIPSAMEPIGRRPLRRS